ncbi:MAG: hypothetical protein KC978_07425 [Candidatus Omnitrophica bacterium]|nr:hypothetical protein [Candidatus Omnitrophota bacterium]
MKRYSTTFLLAVIASLTGFLPRGVLCEEAPLVGEATQVCVITDKRINEASGLALSHLEPDAVWIHNDSGDSARLFLVGMDGNTRGVFHLADVPRPLDWEDMCSFTLDGEPWLMIGDVGDNSINRHFVTPDTGLDRACRLLLIHEPRLNDATRQERVPVHTTILFEYEDGPRNCETVAVDTERKEILMVSKSKPTPRTCGLYSIPLTLTAGSTKAIAKRICDLDLDFASAMDVAPDNQRLVIISSKGALIVDREANEGWGDAIQRGSRSIELPKRENGETVCFGRNRDELLLNSELIGQPLWSVMIPAPVSAP